MGLEVSVRGGVWALTCLGWGVWLAACSAAVPCEADCEDSDIACLSRSCAMGLDVAARPAVDCSTFPEGGRCLGPRVVERCEGGQLLWRDCDQDEVCVESGGARCETDAACVDGAERCAEAGALTRCEEGRWRSAVCDSTCVTVGHRGWCGAPGATLSGTARYARRGPDASFRDWAPDVEQVAARGFLVASYRDDVLLDTTVTDARGRFTVRVADTVGPGDTVVLYAAGRGARADVAYAVADPALVGEQRLPVQPGDSARIWSWARSTRALMSSPTIDVEESEGAGAAAVFASLEAAWRGARERYGYEGLPVVAWLGFGTTWSCGACFAPWTVTAAGRTWRAQLWVPGSDDAAWWSDAMVLHELGHWVMASHGTSPGEGGPHYLGVPTFPGQAWSEGWATWFSSDARGSPRYFDRQDGTMFWLDLARREPSFGWWSRPRPEAGLLQRIEENEVSAILYRLGTATPSRQVLYEALAAPEMNLAPWQRGYRKHTWRMAGVTPVDVVETDTPAPCLADFLDALRCGGFPRSVVEAAVEPTTAYPYPSHDPLCR
ncbi:hypothetical protein LY474_16370 [Myxococcus stipitatus]|uniref:hypothetical protein n=1 Tax=Myxococcus stipitatus TaxID=83455 RepID=UPI001F2975E1|nr:hypothetical protein [Myxococcus stipitatus]MCE9669386.1 hypothetical protein [Myxococcus stipitatus]